MEIPEYLTHEELVDAVENDNSASNYKVAADFLLNAVTEWPTLNLKEPYDLLKELDNEIKDKLTFDNLNTYMKHLNPAHEAWKMEAVNALLEMFDFDRYNNFDREIELKTIIKRITEHYRH